MRNRYSLSIGSAVAYVSAGLFALSHAVSGLVESGAMRGMACGWWNYNRQPIDRTEWHNLRPAEGDGTRLATGDI